MSLKAFSEAPSNCSNAKQYREGNAQQLWSEMGPDQWPGGLRQHPHENRTDLQVIAY